MADNSNEPTLISSPTRYTVSLPERGQVATRHMPKRDTGPDTERMDLQTREFVPAEPQVIQPLEATSVTVDSAEKPTTTAMVLEHPVLPPTEWIWRMRPELQQRMRHLAQRNLRVQAELDAFLNHKPIR